MDEPIETHVVTVFLRCEGDVLLLRRSSDVGTYSGAWGAVAGHVEGDPDESARREISEETGIQDADLTRRGRAFAVDDSELGKRWIVHPYLFDTDQRDVRLNWESSNYEWASPTDILMRDAVPQLWTSYKAVAPTLESIRGDREHGSAYISHRALEVLRDAAILDRDMEDLRTLAVEILEARPSMAVVRNRINRVMYQASDPGDIARLAHEAIGTAVNNDRRAARNASEMIQGKTVLTLSRSGTVSDAILRARPHVFIAESRPGGEGIEEAARMDEAGIDVTLVPDAGVASLPVFDLVLVGADTILPAGDVVNKLGTHLLGLLAAARKVPMYVASSADKILADGEVELESEHVSSEVKTWSPLFERTPAALIRGYLTEDGLLSPEDVSRQSEHLRKLESWRGRR